MSDRLSFTVAGLLHALLGLWLLAIVVPPKVELAPRPAPAVTVDLLMLETNVAELEDLPPVPPVTPVVDAGEPLPAPIAPAPASTAPITAPKPVVETPPVQVAAQTIAPAAVEPTPQPQLQPPPAKRRTFDANDLSTMLERANPVRKRPSLKVGELSSLLDKSLPQGAARLNSFQLSSLIAIIRAQITPCWNVPTAPDGAGNIVVLLRIELRPDGSLIGIPEVLSVKGATAATAAYGRGMASSVRRAVSLCSPLKLPAEHYESWREVELNFDSLQIL